MHSFWKKMGKEPGKLTRLAPLKIFLRVTVSGHLEVQEKEYDW